MSDNKSNKGQLQQLMSAGLLNCVFQPISDLQAGVVFAHEALIRGPKDTNFHNPDKLFKLAEEEGLILEFELHCLHQALNQWGQFPEPGRLFVNLSANALLQASSIHGSASLVNLIRSYGVLPRMLILEITEHERTSDMDRFRKEAHYLNSEGISLALDDFGDGRSSLKLWSEIKPAFVKIDKYFTKELGSRTENLQMVHALKCIAEVFGTQLVAEGIESGNDLRILRDLQLAYGQGYLLGYPTSVPARTITAESAKILKDKQIAVLPHLQQNARPNILRGLKVIKARAVSPDAPNSEVESLFQACPDLHAVAVVEDERPIAMINRDQFMSQYATMYFRELNGRRPCKKFANYSPRLIELNEDVDNLLGILTSEDQRYLIEGFIVTDNGRYVGLGTGEQLVRAVTEARIEAARHANPLTSLPGNIPISLHIQRLLNNGTEFVACYIDLNHFKPFNDHYGYWRGDEMIRLAAQTCLRYCDPCCDFVGHVGGDDFVILFQSADWQPRCERIIDDFAVKALTLFDEIARLAGGIEAEDRHGVVRFFPCTTLSVGAVLVKPNEFEKVEQVANAAAIAKHRAKNSSSGLYIAKREAAIPEKAAI
ncbi:GGDEF domain-containing protein [Nitrosomonas sp. Is37]|uniref:GGDEF domain-containing protein n=1 Tax=Nitrosomonas sp. Is37 TaxID=3080535 RepID=UPI00294B1056|nr:GGDEF domain-containing protein [Nitrosomonas sp. Is37]MDV6344381.1 GGDEF domain-containing protein [Nitrosomonas sp. Is37]